MSQLQQFLARTPLPWLIVSHDRTLLNTVCTRTLFLRDTRLYAFDLPYAQAVEQLRQHDAAAEHSRTQEEREIARLKVSARRLATWGKVYDNEDLARKAKTMEKRIDKLEASRTFVSRGSGLRLALAARALEGNQVLYVTRLSVCAVPGQPLYEIDELILRPGDRVALLGVNGVGKSTTFQLLRQSYARPQPQHVRFHPGVQLGYYDQQLAAFDVPLGRLAWLRQHTNGTEDDLKQVLIHSGVPFADFQQPVNRLSGGEKARMMFMRFRIEQPNFLLLDEPTNHLDLEGQEQLEAELIGSAATLFITSHDRTFIDRLATRWLWIHQGQLRELTSPQPFYQSLLMPQNNAPAASRPAPAAAPSHPAAPLTDQDAVLARIELLENLLQADLARKVRFQKPARQQQWRMEMAQLWRQLEEEE
jgi:ATPase subunit of ABC transporter with duplicated ATPase domains